MSMEGKFKWLAEKVLDETKGGKVPENKIEPPADDQGNEEKFDQATVKAVENKQTVQHAVYNLFDRIDDIPTKLSLIEEFIDLVEEAGSNEGYTTEGKEHVYLNNYDPSMNPLYHKAKEYIKKYGYDEVHEVALNYQLAVRSDWSTPENN